MWLKEHAQNIIISLRWRILANKIFTTNSPEQQHRWIIDIELHSANESENLSDNELILNCYCNIKKWLHLVANSSMKMYHLPLRRIPIINVTNNLRLLERW